MPNETAVATPDFHAEPVVQHIEHVKPAARRDAEMLIEHTISPTTRNIASARQCGFDDAVFGACIHTYILAWLQAYVLACLHTFLHIYILLLDL